MLVKLFTISYIILASVLISSEGLIAANATPGIGKLYGTDAIGGNLYTIIPSTGVATLVGAMGIGGVTSLAVDPTTGTMYASTGLDGTIPGALYTVTQSTGGTTIVVGSGGTSNIDMDFDSSGTLYASTFSSLNIINKATGAESPVGVPFGAGDMTGIAFAPDGKLYGATTGGSLYTINKGSGLATLVAAVLDNTGAPVGKMTALHFACDGTLYGGTSGGHLITINPSNGVFTLIGDSVSHSLGALAFDTSCPTEAVVGGKILPIDTTALFVAGTFTNAFWILPTLGGIAGTAVALFKMKRKHD